MCGNLTADCLTSSKALLASSWTAVAKGYEEVLVQRFRPWTNDALEKMERYLGDHTHLIQSPNQDEISALVLCCGPGQELLPIAKMIPNCKVFGTDLASGMVDRAKARIDRECQLRENSKYLSMISVDVGDATDLPAGLQHDVIFSAFGLQQIPHPIDAVRNWVRHLKPDGICTILYWPPSQPQNNRPPEDKCPFTLWGRLVRNRLGREGDECVWDDKLVDAIEGHADVLKDELIEHEICWNDATELFDGMSKAGPWHALRLRRGDQFVDELGARLIRFYSTGKREKLCHMFTARLIICKKRR